MTTDSQEFFKKQDDAVKERARICSENAAKYAHRSTYIKSLPKWTKNAKARSDARVQIINEYVRDVAILRAIKQKRLDALITKWVSSNV